MAKKTCFVICPIGNEGSDTRKWSDSVLKYIITPPVIEAGYEDPVRANDIPESGIITTQIVQRIMECDLVVADLTGPNANVLYELAIRHAMRKPVVHLVEKGQQIPFDVAGMRAIEIGLDLESADKGKQDITAQIAAIEANPASIQNPISVAVDFGALNGNGGGDNAKILNALATIQNQLELLTARARAAGQVTEDDGAMCRALLEMGERTAPTDDALPQQGRDRLPSAKARKALWWLLQPTVSQDRMAFESQYRMALESQLRALEAKANPEPEKTAELHDRPN